MIVSENNSTKLSEFQNLMSRTSDFLNFDAGNSPRSYLQLSGIKLEPFIEEVLNHIAVGTPFENTIKRWGGHRFPDIVAKKFFGVEVKTTTGDHWTSIGNSILESTRVEDVDHIYMLFGKLSTPVSFKIKPYQDCLSEIVVTHYPRYMIDMDLKAGDTIFDKMGIPYDDLRKLEEPTIPVAQYYKSLLKEGQSLWWIGETAEAIEASSPMTIRVWNTLNAREQAFIKAKGMILFPEILLSSEYGSKYNNFSLWLIINNGILLSNVRDLFSAGGRMDLVTRNKRYSRLPKVFTKISQSKSLIEYIIGKISDDEIEAHWKRSGVKFTERLPTWISMTAMHYKDIELATEILTNIFT